MTKFPEGGPGLTTAGRLAALVSAAAVSVHTRVDPDLWGHLRFGLDAMRDRQLVAIDPYSFTQDKPWINHEWLSEVALASAYKIGGVPGALLMKTAILGATFAIMAALTRRISGPARWWILAFSIIALTPVANTIRPQLWTLLALATLNWALWSSPPRLYLLPFLCALWANLHGGWIVGVGVAGIWIIGRAFDLRSLRGLAQPAGILALAVLATLINPYGFGLWAFLWSTVGVGREISEWRPLWQQADLTFPLLWAVTWIVVVGVARMTGVAAVTWARALPVVSLGVLGALVARLAPLFAIVALGACSDCWKGRQVVSEPARPKGFAFVDAAIALAVALVLLIPTARCMRIDASWTPDLEAAAALQPTSVAGRLVVPFDWGEYALWHWSPRLRVSVDGRRETIYSDAVVSLQTAVATGQPAGIEFLDHVRPEYVWLENARGGRTADWLSGNGYSIDVKTTRSFVARRGDLSELTQGPPASPCFP